MTAVSARSESIRTPEGQLEAHVAVPASGSGPGIVLLHEIFGVDDHVRDAARWLAELGYVVLAPDLYWRTQPRLELDHHVAGVEAGMAAAANLDLQAAVGDAIDALEVLRSMPEVVDRRAGVLGVGLGGALAHRAAVHGEPDVVVVHHGSEVADVLDGADQIACPLIVHSRGAAAWELTAAFLAREFPAAGDR